MTPVRTAMVGAGAVTDMYLDSRILSLQDEGEVEFVATYSRRPERAQALAARLGGRPYTDTGSLLADPNVEAVVVATPHTAHAEMVLAAIAAGKHVLVEKPIAVELQDARRMVLAARQAGVVLAVIENYHFFEPFVKARQLIEEGAIGTLSTLRTHRVSYIGGNWMTEGWRARQEAGGVLLDQGCHYVHCLRLLAGEEVLAVNAMTTHTRPDFDAEDSVVMNLRFASGLVGQLFRCWSCRTSYFGPEAHVYGHNGSLDVFRKPAGTLILHRPELPNGQRMVVEGATYNDSFIPTFRDFFQAVRGEKQASMSGIEGFRDLAVVDAARRSVRSGRVEAVEDL